MKTISKLLLLTYLFVGYHTFAQQLMHTDGSVQTWTTDVGTLYDSGGDGGDYLNNELGTLTIYPTNQSTDKIFLRFLEFRVENQATCNYDYLEVYDGDDLSNLIGKYCGIGIPNTVQSTHVTGAVTLVWSSDISIADAGFKIDVTVITPTETVQLGDPNSTTTNGRVASYGYYDFSWSALVYKAAEIGVPIIIDEIQFDVENDINTTMTNQKIFIAHTTMDIFPDGTEPVDGDIEISDWTLVYTGDITWTQGWNSITLDAPFTFNGLGNLLIKTINEHGVWTFDYPLFRYTSAPNTVVYNYADGGAPSANGWRNNYRPNMRLGFGGGFSLPIELLSFDAELSGDNVDINWSVTSQVNNDYYSILRSIDAYEWTEIGRVEGAGNSNSQMNYKLVDKDPYLGTSYYRLKQTDFNGVYEEFPPVSVNYDIEIIGLLISPNPVKDIITLTMDGNLHNDLHVIKVFDGQGNIIFSNNLIGNLEDYEVNVSKLSSGIYIVKVKNKRQLGLGKFIKE